MSKNPSRKARIFPVKILIVTIFVTAFLFLAEGLYLWQSYQNQRVILGRNVRLTDLSDIVIYLDEVLTMSSRMAAATGDPRWEERYRHFEPKLDAAIREVKKLAPEIFLQKDAASVDQANRKLVEMQNRAFSLVRKGLNQEAALILFSKEYNQQKEFYAKGINSISTALRKEAKNILILLRQRVFFVGLVTCCLIFVLLFLWFNIVRRLRQYDKDKQILEETLRREKELAQMYLDVVGVILVALDAEEKVILINRRGCEILGYAKEEIIGKSWFDNFVPKDISVEMKKVFQRLLRREDGLFGYFENPVLTKSRKQRIIGWNNAVIKDESAKPVGILSSGEDITERKRAEEKNSRLTRMYSTLYEVNKVMLRIRQRQKLFDEVCRIAVEKGNFLMAWIGMLEPASRVIKPIASFGSGKELLDKVIVSAEDIPEGRGPTGVAVRQERFSFVNDIAKDSRMLPWQSELLERGCRSSAAFPIRLGGRVIGAFNFFASEPDIFDKEEIELLEELAENISFALDFMEEEYSRKLMEEALQEDDSRYAIVTQETGHIVYDYDVKTGLINWSGAIEELTGFSKEEFKRVDIGRWEAMIHSQDRQRAIFALEETKNKRGRYDITYRFRHKNGSYIYIEDTGLFLQDKAGIAYRMLGIMKHITAQV